MRWRALGIVATPDPLGMVLMAGRKVDPERERLLLSLIASGMTPNRAAGVAGVSVGFAYGLDRKVSGVARLAGMTTASRIGPEAAMPGCPVAASAIT